MTWLESLRASLGPPGPLRPGDTAVVAASGGVDSTALLLGLAKEAPDFGVSLHVAHLDHGWRESHGSRIVTELAASLDLGVSVGRLPWSARRDETSARERRRAFLRQVARQVGARAVFLAHQADEQAETVLAHLLQGSGARGLGGMEKVAGEFWLRPLLGVPKAELEAFVRERGAEIEEDPTNSDSRHLRNWIRGDLVPSLEARLPGAGRAVVRYAAFRREDEAHFGRLLERLWKDRVEVHPPGYLLRLEREEIEDRSLMDRLSMRLLESLGRRPTAPQVAALGDALRRGRGGGGRGIGAFPARGGIWIGPAAPLGPLPTVTVPRRGIVAWPHPLAPGLGATVLGLPEDLPLVLRSAVPGDRLRHHRTKLKEILAEGRIPAPLRPRVPIVAAPDGVVAALGLWDGDGGGLRARFDPRRQAFIVGVLSTVLN